MKFEVRFFQDEDGNVPALNTFEVFNRKNPKVAIKFQARIEQLEEHGSMLKRPAADYLRDGIYELRVRIDGVHHRLLYFFAGGRAVAVLSHFITKKKRVPNKEIDLAVKRKKLVLDDPNKYTLLE